MLEEAVVGHLLEELGDEEGEGDAVPLRRGGGRAGARRTEGRGSL